MTGMRFSRRMRAAQLEYSRAESAMCNLPVLMGQTDFFVVLPQRGPKGELFRLFIVEGKEAQLRRAIGDDPINRWLAAQAEVDRLSADPRHYRVKDAAA